MGSPRPQGGLPGVVISFYIVPLKPAYPASAGRGTVRPKIEAQMKMLIRIASPKPASNPLIGQECH